MVTANASPLRTSPQNPVRSQPTFTDDDYARARRILVGRYPGLVGSDVIDEMVQRAAVTIWERRRAGLPVSFRELCLWVGAAVRRDGPRVRSPRAKREGLLGTRYPHIDSHITDRYLAEVRADTPDPLDRAATSEFLRALSSEEREIVLALLDCGGRRDMADVAEMVGATRPRVYHVLWLLRRRMRAPLPA